MVGSGAAQALGVFTPSAHGISTGRDVSEGNDATAVKFAGLKAAKWTLRGGYHNGAVWVAHRDFYKQVDTEREDGATGAYLWEPSAKVGEPDRLLGFPTRISEYAPNTFTTGKYVSILGNFREGYWIADLLNFTMKRLNELFALRRQVGLLVEAEVDGMPVDEEAFVRVQLG